MINYLYEFKTFCTSAIVKQSDGRIIHDRNLDFSFAEGMRRLSYEAHFMKNGKVVFKTVMFTGITGVYTGMREGAYSISENTRTPNHDQPLSVL